MKPGELIYIASELLSGICGTERAASGALSFPVSSKPEAEHIGIAFSILSLLAKGC